MDFFGSAPDLPTLETAIKQVPWLWQKASTDANTGVTTPGRIAPQLKLPDGTEWVFVPWGKWEKPTGATTTDAMGNTVPLTANDGKFYFFGRWNGDPTHLPFSKIGATMAVDPGTGVTTITMGAVTLVSPPPADCPLSM